MRKHSEPKPDKKQTNSRTRNIQAGGAKPAARRSQHNRCRCRNDCGQVTGAVPGRRSRRLRRRFALVERSEQKLWARDKTIRALPGAEFGAILKP